MTTYRVTWKIDIDADSPEEAAARALITHRDPESTATVFELEWQNVDGSFDSDVIDLSEDIA